METSLLFARVARRTVTKQHRRFKKEQGKENRRRRKKKIGEKERERESRGSRRVEKRKRLIDGAQPKNSSDTTREGRGHRSKILEPMIYHRQWQRDRKKYHLISQMSNSSLSATFSDSISQAYCLVSREEEEVKGRGGGARKK